MSKFNQYFPGENVLLEQSGWYTKSIINAKTGTIVLTDKRIAFIEEKQIVGGGLLVAAADAALGVSKPSLKVDIEFTNLDKWEHPRKNDIKVFNKAGEGFNLRGLDWDTWNGKLEELTGKKSS